MARILIVGAGFSGAVLAEQLAAYSDHTIVVVEERSHLGGHCHTQRHGSTGIMLHVYGPHIFNTSNEKVWKYVQRFAKFYPYINRVKAVTDRGVFSLPINLLTINQIFGTKFNPREAEEFIKSQGDHSIKEASNFEEQALKYLGPTLYETFFRGYTIKQWGCDPKELPASILKRLPVRFNYDDSYYLSKYQGIPIEGYTTIIASMLAANNITVKLGQKYDSSWNADFDYVFYSGPLDAYFKHKYGYLGYRTIEFEIDVFEGPDYQGNPVINYCEASIPYTRVHEHSHFAQWENYKSSVYLREYARETGPNDIPFYPKRLRWDLALLSRYRELGQCEEKVSFIGRLGTYRYLDMHHVIDESLNLAHNFLSFDSAWNLFPRFANNEVAI